MNKNVIVGCHVCTVKYLPRVIGKPLPGEATCSSDVAYFEFADSRNVVINDDREPCFGPGRASFLQVGDEIVARVEEIRRGHFVITWWTHVNDFNKALGELKAMKEVATKPKPAPVLPLPVLQAIPVSLGYTLKEEEKPKNQTNGKDRRQIFQTKKMVQSPVAQPQQVDDGNVLNFENAVAQAAAEMEKATTVGARVSANAS